MLKNGTKSIIEEECLPVLINCTKLQSSEEDNEILKKTLTKRKTTTTRTTQQPGTFKNLTNKKTTINITTTSSISKNFVLSDCQNDVSTVINDKNNNKIAVKTLYPRVIENSFEEKLSTLLPDKSSITLSFDAKASIAKHKQKFAKKQLNLNSAEQQVALNDIDTLACNSVQTETKQYQAKRTRANTYSKQSPESDLIAARSKRIRTATTRHENAAVEEVLCTPTALTEIVVKNSKKRARIMSLYERRYQTDDARSSQPGVVSNGYLSSTRNSSAASSTVHSDENTDISNQYYIAASAASATASAASALANGSSSNYAPSMATLCNIGNTCYLNSVVYTLRFAPQFVHNLHHLIVDLSNIQQNIGKHRANKSSSLGRNISGAQMENARSWSSKDLASFDNYNVAAIAGSNNSSTQLETQKSSQQLLTEKLHELYQNLHRNEIADSAEPFHADTLLHAIQEVSSIFEGNQQQDAHEFLMCVLNSIRETCQTLIKAIADCPDDILNGCISSNEQTDAQNAFSSDKDVVRSSQSSQTHSGGGNTGSSSLSSSNITKASFFTRKSKRKEESKSSKNQRLQSPLKESAHTTVGSNSLFYLNTVDLSGANGKQQQQQQQQTTNSNELSSNSYNSTAATVATTLQNNSSDPQAGGDDNVQDITTLKEKDRLAEKIRQLGLDFFRDDFEGITVSTTKCLSCETITEQKESMIDIAVPVPITGFDNADYMDKPNTFIQNSCITREYFRGENKYRCEQCIGYTEAIRSISYEVLPRLLVIQLSRFSGGMEKINSYIPTSFTLQCFCAKCCELNDSNKLHIYKLYSVITHVGATMSVGHYIAYTCSLDWANEYINCPKDMRRNQQFGSAANGLQKNAATSAVGAGNVTSGVGTNTSSSQSSAASAAASVLASSGTSLMKKMKFGRSKASSSGDMSKNVKNLNGVTSKTITNGIGKLSMNATCHSVRCCATRFKSSEAASSGTPISASQNSTSSSINGVGVGGLYISNNSDLSDENLQNGSSHHSSNSASYNYSTSGYGSTGRGGGVGASSKTSQSSSLSSSNNSEPIWYMCDDDKIKAMTQREFEELLSPSRKITITPYLLFYARIDLQTIASQPTPPKQAQTTTTATTTQSWPANDSSVLQRGQLDKM